MPRIIWPLRPSASDYCGSRGGCNLVVGGETTDFLVCHLMRTNDLNNVYVANAQTKLSANAGQLVRFTAATRPGGATGTLHGFASGYYVPARCAAKADNHSDISPFEQSN